MSDCYTIANAVKVTVQQYGTGLVRISVLKKWADDSVNRIEFRYV